MFKNNFFKNIFIKPFFYKNFSIKSIFILMAIIQIRILYIFILNEGLINFFLKKDFIITVYLYSFILIFLSFFIFLIFFKFFNFFSLIYYFNILWQLLLFNSVIFFLHFFDKNETLKFNIFKKDFFLNNLNINICFNGLSINYIIIITIITIFANKTTSNYMKNDQKREIFLILLNLFSLSMVLFVSTNNIILMFFAWEFLGISSFFLIYHYDLKSIVKKSALKAITFNRASDLTFLVAIVIFYINTNTFNINNKVILEFILNNNKINLYFMSIDFIILFTILIFYTAITKSTQIITYYWLPDSMEAPVPASALIHSATLIASGFFLLLKFHLIFIYFNFLNIFCYIGLITAFFGSIIAFFQNDLKKILAFSTIGNCGFMLSLISHTNINLFMIYFSLHGLFKSFSFMNCAYYIEKYNHIQDNRKKNNFFFKKNYQIFLIFLPITLLGGLPITYLFFFKHLFFLNIYINYNIFIIFNLMYALFSVLYSIRFLYKIFFDFNFFKNKNNILNKYNYLYLYIISIFFIFSILYYSFFFNIDFSIFNINLFFNKKLNIDLFIITIFINYLIFFKTLNNFNKNILYNIFLLNILLIIL